MKQSIPFGGSLSFSHVVRVAGLLVALFLFAQALLLYHRKPPKLRNLFTTLFTSPSLKSSVGGGSLLSQPHLSTPSPPSMNETTLNRILTLPTLGLGTFYWEPEYVGEHKYDPIVFVFEAVYVCGTSNLALIARTPPGQGMHKSDYARIRGSFVDGGNGGVLLSQEPMTFAWGLRLDYEPVSVGIWHGPLPMGLGRACNPPRQSRGGATTSLRGGGGGGGGGGGDHHTPGSSAPGGVEGGVVAPLPDLHLKLTYGPGNRWVWSRPIQILPPPIPLTSWRARAVASHSSPSPLEHRLLLPPTALTPYAICTTVLTPSDLIRLWVRYYTLKGVGAFYLYAVAPTPTEASDLAATLTRLLQGYHGGAAITLIPWPFPMYYTRGGDANYAQPPALNSCVSRYAGAHSGGLLMYDVDEFLVTRHHKSVGEWLGALGARYGHLGPHTYVTSMAWAVVGATPQDFNATTPAFRLLRQSPRPPPLERNCSGGGYLDLCPLNCTWWGERGRGGPGRFHSGNATAGSGSGSGSSRSEEGQEGEGHDDYPHYLNPPGNWRGGDSSNTSSSSSGGNVKLGGENATLASHHHPIPPHPQYDDDDRGGWSANDTLAEDFCWREWAGEAYNVTVPGVPPELVLKSDRVGTKVGRRVGINTTNSSSFTPRKNSTSNTSLNSTMKGTHLVRNSSSSSSTKGSKNLKNTTTTTTTTASGDEYDDHTPPQSVYDDGDYEYLETEEAVWERGRNGRRYLTPLRPLPTPLGIPPSRLTILSLLSAPITRTVVKVGGGREKYVLPNTSALLQPGGLGLPPPPELPPQQRGGATGTGAGTGTGAAAGAAAGAATPAVVNIHGMYASPRQIHLQPEDGYHLHFLNDNRPEAFALRVGAFLFHYLTKEKYNTTLSVHPPDPRNVEEPLFLEEHFTQALVESIRESGGRGGGGAA